ncbi:MAG: CoB--CoM heterodisulfide reductase iron-sulfur subunit A family protein [Candidatus Thermoplasmatota archaeon]|nr:CoB--CoM heterodisulfide reductase iron-sulfur subunit A family protein [Candidatus Thermoplasmatota archaeon]
MPERSNNDVNVRKGLAVFLCACRGQISKKVDLEKIAEDLKKNPEILIVDIHEALCSREGQDYLKEKAKEINFERVAVGACSPNVQGIIVTRALEEEGLNKYLVEQINIREHCAWVHNDKKAATKKAESLVRGAIARAEKLVPLEDIDIEILDKALVIGGGVTGMQVALDIANSGFKTYLVERSGELGGRTYKLSMTFPTHNCGICCMQYCKECVFTPKIEDVQQNKNIDVMLESEIEEITGGFGDRHVKVRTPSGTKEFDVGTIIVATGSKTFDPKRIPELRYDLPDVITTVELEQLIVEQREKGGGLKRPSDSKVPKTVNFIQCVGSRDKNKGNLHCSLVCCTYAIGQAREIKRMNPDADIYIHYIDLRGPYRGFEEFYEAAKEEGINFVRGRISEIVHDKGKIFVRALDTDADVLLNIESDLVVLSVGQEPADGSDAIAKMLHVQTDIDKFMKDINPMFPSEFRRGVYVAGTAQGPKGIRYSIEDAKAAAASAIELMRKGNVKFPRIVAFVDEERCRGCGRCEKTCEYGAITIETDPKRGVLVSKIDEVLCEGCGQCAVVCCNKAITVNGFRPEQVEAMVRALVEEVDADV